MIKLSSWIWLCGPVDHKYHLALSSHRSEMKNQVLGFFFGAFLSGSKTKEKNLFVLTSRPKAKDKNELVDLGCHKWQNRKPHFKTWGIKMRRKDIHSQENQTRKSKLSPPQIAVCTSLLIIIHNVQEQTRAETAPNTIPKKKRHPKAPSFYFSSTWAALTCRSVNKLATGGRGKRPPMRCNVRTFAFPV